MVGGRNAKPYLCAMLSALKNSNRPFMIAGPCSAESAEQVMEVARSLDTSRVDLLRAGIWKPRTRPDSFEGMGEKALPWLVEALCACS